MKKKQKTKYAINESRQQKCVILTKMSFNCQSTKITNKTFIVQM